MKLHILQFYTKLLINNFPIKKIATSLPDIAYRLLILFSLSINCYVIYNLSY